MSLSIQYPQSNPVRLQPIFLVGVTLLLLTGCGANDSEYVNHQGATMGTYWRISHDRSCGVDGRTVQGELDALNRVFSTYDPGSELSNINAAPAEQWLAISNHLQNVLAQARETWQSTGGAFDVTIGPLVNLWGFGAQENSPQTPSLESQEAAINRVGMQHVELGSGQLKKKRPDLYIDLSAVAKGYAVDVVANSIAKDGCNNFMVDIGGEIRVQGINSKALKWRLGIESPALDTPGVQRVVALSGQAIATSGDYRNFKWVNGVRVDHILDPRIGQPTQNRVASVTVIHPQAMIADAYATAFMVLGYEAGMALAEQHNLAVYFILHKVPQVSAKSPSQTSHRPADALPWQTHYNEGMQNYFVN